jgi:hypothetical protein
LIRVKNLDLLPTGSIRAKYLDILPTVFVRVKYLDILLPPSSDHQGDIEAEQKGER